MGVCVVKLSDYNEENSELDDPTSQNIELVNPAPNSQNIFEKQALKESIFLNKDIISSHYVPENLPFRENQINTLTQGLASLAQNSKPNNFFIYGKTGTGKTATVRHVLEQLADFVEKRKLKAKSTYINCRNHPSKYKVLLKAVKAFYPENDFLGYSASFVYEKLLDYAVQNSAHLILVLDEIDKVKDVDDLVYSLSRGNDELGGKGSITIIGISNNLLFKDKLDPRTKSSLCEKEMVFSPYNAQELQEILKERCELAFKPGTITMSAIMLASAYAAKESGDARTAVMLLQRAGEITDAEQNKIVGEKQVEQAKATVEEEIILSMIITLPEHEQLVLYSIANLTLKRKGLQKVSGEIEEGVLYSGEIYESYLDLVKGLSKGPITSRWFRQYINELEMYGLIFVTSSGKGIKGQTRLIKLGFDANKIKTVIEKELVK